MNEKFCILLEFFRKHFYDKKILQSFKKGTRKKKEFEMRRKRGAKIEGK